MNSFGVRPNPCSQGAKKRAPISCGKAPTELVQVTQEQKAPFKTTASRPMCIYPATPRYDGKGDANDRESFSCVKQ